MPKERWNENVNVQRKGGVGIGLVVGTLLALASAAYACTTWEGKMTVAAGSGTSTAEAFGGNMNWCDPSSGNASVDDAVNQQVTVSVAPTSSGDCPPGTSKLPASSTNYVYNIRWTPGEWDPNSAGVNDCMDTSEIGDFSVNSSGIGGPTGSDLFDPGDPGTIQICVVTTSTAWGNQVSIEVI